MSDQFVVFDTEGTTLYEIHQDDEGMGGFDYTNQAILSGIECTKLIRKLNDSQRQKKFMRKMGL